MKLLLCVSSLHDVEPALKEFASAGSRNTDPAGTVVSLQTHSFFPFLHSAKILHHEVDMLETGVGIYQTAYKVTKALTQQKYHLALKLSYGNVYKEETTVGTVLNVVNEKPGDFGMTVNGEWKDHYDSGLQKRENEPHVRGGFVNLTNAYMNVFMPFKKAVGVTVNHYANVHSYLLRKEKYKADCETGDGLGFTYPCLFEKQSFYHLCIAERNLNTGDENFETAKKVMNETLIDLIRKL